MLACIPSPPKPKQFGELTLAYHTKLGKKVSNAIHGKVKSGKLVGQAPLAYRNQRTSIGSQVVEDEEKAAFVKEAFLMLSEKNSPPSAVLRELTKRGFTNKKGQPLSLLSLLLVVSNPFYSGLIRYKGMLYPGIHEPLITWETFDKVKRSLMSSIMLYGHLN